MGKFNLIRIVASLLLLATALLARAAEAPATAADPVLEKRVMAIAQELRCLVCQNQTIADSDADLAVDLRQQVREKLAQGMSDRDVSEFMVARYGDFVLYRPPVKTTTWLLWFGPFLLLLGGVFFLVRFLRQRQQEHVAHVTPALTDDERRQAQALLDTPDPRP